MINKKRSIVSILTCLVFICVWVIPLSTGCSGGGDPTGAVLGISDENGELGQSPGNLRGMGPDDSRIFWGGYLLDIRPDEGVASVRPWERSTNVHIDVTSVVTKPACSNCVRLEDCSFDKSAGVFDCDAVLANPTVLGGYDVRAVLLLDEWDTGRRLESEAGLTDFWSGDPYRPDPYILYATEDEDRYFGPMGEYSSHVTLSFPTPFNFIVPFIVDASYPDHAEEPVEMSNISVEGSIHPTGYSLTITVDLLDWQDDAQGVYLDCSPLNPLAGFQEFGPPVGPTASEDFSTWTLNLQYDATQPGAWLPMVEGEFELPILALDSVSTAKIYQRVTVEVTPDTQPPQWTGEVGIDEIWWGSRRAIVSFFPAVDPSGPVLYNIYSSSDMPLILPRKDTITGWSHYAVETVNGATYMFVVKAEDQAGNEDDNSYEITGLSRGMSQIWEQVFAADLESTPNVFDMDGDSVEDVIFGCDNGMVYSLAGDTGEVKWYYQTGGMVKSTAAIADVNDDSILDVLIGSNDTTVYALNLLMTQPYPVATFPTGGLVESSPVCADQTGDGVPELIVGSFDNNVYSFEGGTGSILLTYDTGAPVMATPSLEDFDGDTHLDVVVASGGVVSAVNGITGETIWAYDFSTGFSLGSPAIGDLNEDGIGDVVLGSGNGIYAFDVANENLLWANEGLEGSFDTCPALGDITGDGIPDVAISSRFRNVYVLAGTDGSLVWVSDDEIFMPTSPTLADMNADDVVDVVVGSVDFYLRILNGADGYTLHEWDTAPYGVITTIPLINDVDRDGDIDIVFGTESHYMFAITTNHPVPTDPDLLPWPKFMRNRTNTGNLGHPLV